MNGYFVMVIMALTFRSDVVTQGWDPWRLRQDDLRFRIYVGCKESSSQVIRNELSGIAEWRTL